MRTPLRILTMMALVGAMASPAASGGGGCRGQSGSATGHSGSAVPDSGQLSSGGISRVTAAQQLTTGPNPTSIDRIFASLGDLDSGSNGSFALTAQLFADDPSHKIPDALLTTFTYNAGSIPTSGWRTSSSIPARSRFPPRRTTGSCSGRHTPIRSQQRLLERHLAVHAVVDDLTVPGPCPGRTNRATAQRGIPRVSRRTSRS